VISTTPFSVRRKRRASSSGSSPTTIHRGCRRRGPPRPWSAAHAGPPRHRAGSPRSRSARSCGHARRCREASASPANPTRCSRRRRGRRSPRRAALHVMHELRGRRDLGIGPDRPVAVEEVELRHTSVRSMFASQ
jgi:hypothetical protein